MSERKLKRARESDGQDKNSAIEYATDLCDLRKKITPLLEQLERISEAEPLSPLQGHVLMENLREMWIEWQEVYSEIAMHEKFIDGRDFLNFQETNAKLEELFA